MYKREEKLMQNPFSFLRSESDFNLDSEKFENNFNNDKGAVLIDVRTPEEFHAGHIPGEIERLLSPDFFTTPTVLLCSEPTAEHCHRRLVVEYLDATWGDVSAVHL
jgi:rhodanese-related sulfurtransferase